MIEEDDIYPSQAFPLIDKVKKKCLKDLLQHGNLLGLERLCLC